MMQRTFRTRIQDGPSALPAPPLPNAGGVVVATLPPGRYELHPQLDGSIQVARMDTARTGDAGGAMTPADVQRKNSEFWSHQPGAAR